MKYRFIILKPDTESSYPDSWKTVYTSHTYHTEEDCIRVLTGMMESYNSTVHGEVIEIKSTVKNPGKEA